MTREEAINIISQMVKDEEGFLSDDTVEAHKMAIKALEQEPKTGHWIVTDDDLVYCSECEDSYYPRPIDASWYYCPHCGAKMQ